MLTLYDNATQVKSVSRFVHMFYTFTYLSLSTITDR
jgi:hypothetical protein